MKTPNRNFVVEYKGSRKRGTPQPKSIWGDIDLRSAAKSVEADGLLPKDTPPPSAAEESQIGLGPTLVESAPKASAVEKLVATEAAETFVAVEETFEDQSSLPSQVHGLEQPAADKNTLPPRKARGKDLKTRRRRAQVAAMADAPSKPESGMAWEDELAQLDAENHSLKRELLEKLRAENEALVAMLQRVSATG